MTKNLNFIASIINNKYFEGNWNNIKNSWKGIKNIITLNNLSYDVPRTLSVDDITISDPCNIANTLFKFNCQKSKG